MPLSPSLLAQLRQLCGDPGEDDGVAPRRRHAEKRKPPVRFCGEVVRFLNVLLPSASDALLQQVVVVRAVLVSERLHVEVLCEDAHAVSRLMAAKAWIRTELATHVHTRRVPDLFFTLYQEDSHETP